MPAFLAAVELFRVGVFLVADFLEEDEVLLVGVFLVADFFAAEEVLLEDAFLAAGFLLEEDFLAAPLRVLEPDFLVATHTSGCLLLDRILSAQSPGRCEQGQNLCSALLSYRANS